MYGKAELLITYCMEHKLHTNIGYSKKETSSHKKLLMRKHDGSCVQSQLQMKL